MDKNNITIHIGHVLFLSFSVLFSESVELSISSLPHCLSFYFHNSYHQSNQALVSRDSYMKGIKYYHLKKERLDINTKFGWCCGGLVVAAWCWSGLLLCFYSGLVWFRCHLPNPAHSQVLVFSKLGVLFSFLSLLFVSCCVLWDLCGCSAARTS